MLWEAFTISHGELTGFFLCDEALKDTHVLENLPLTVADAVLTVEPMLEDALVRIQGVDDRIGIALFVLSEDWDVSQLSNFEEELTEVWPLVDVDMASEVFVLYITR